MLTTLGFKQTIRHRSVASGERYVMGKSPTRAEKRREKRLPDGHETMKRRAPSALGLRPARFESDPKKAYTADQLAEIGAIALKWNQIEAHIDFIGAFILFAKSPLWLRISVEKTLGTKTKLILLKDCLKNVTLLDDVSKQCITDCFSQVEQARTYRNAIIHHHIYDHEKGIGSYIDESHSAYQILVTIDALNSLYALLCALVEELREIDILFRYETDAQRPGRHDSVTGIFTYCDDDELKASIIPQQTERVLAIQEKRKTLSKLPKFPDADLIRSINENEDDQI